MFSAVTRRKVGNVLAIWGLSRTRPQVGHEPSACIALGAQYFAQSSQNGMTSIASFTYPQLQRC